MPTISSVHAFFLAALLALTGYGWAQQGFVNPRGAEGVDYQAANPGVGGGGGAPMGMDRPVLLDPNRKLQQGDQLSIKIEQDREPATLLTVSGTGDVVVEPLESTVRVAGLTVQQAAAEIKRRLEKDYYYTATVRLNLEKANMAATMGYVLLSGAVMRVGPVPVSAEKPMKLSEAILSAGGFGRFADDRRVRVTRPSKSGGPPTVYKCDIKEVLQKGRTEYDFIVQDGDQIFVPETFMKR